MAFNLQKVLRALLFSSSQPLSVKDIQNLFARFHEQAPPVRPKDGDAESTGAAAPADDDAADADVAAPASESAPDEAPVTGQDEVADDENEGADEIPSATADDNDQAGDNDQTGSDGDADSASDEEIASDDEPTEPTPAPDRTLAADAVAEPAAATDPAAVATPAAAADPAEEAVADSPEDHDAELYEDVPSLITGAQIREAMDAISEEMRATADIYLLIEGPSGYRIVTHPRFARWIRILRDEPPPVKLTQSAIETLAIIAYRQPVTRTDIETIRGVSAEAGLNKLLERELVYIMGRADLPGRPLQYGTTDRFLDFVGVKSLVELPASDVLSPRQIDEWLKNATNVRPPADADMGLPFEEGEGESPNLDSVSVDHVEASGEGDEAPALSRAPLPVAADAADADADDATNDADSADDGDTNNTGSDTNDTDDDANGTGSDEAGPSPAESSAETESTPWPEESAPQPEESAAPKNEAGDEDGEN